MGIPFIPFLFASLRLRRGGAGDQKPLYYKWIQTLRVKTNLHPIDRVHSVKEILRTLKKNQLVAILIDQWASRDGLWVDFFGKKTSTTSLPVRLARKTDAALVFGYCIRKASGQYKIILRPEITVDKTEEAFEMKTTLKLNRLLENEIRLYPGQWTWTHRRWKEKSPNSK